MAKTVAERADALPALGEVFRTYGFEGASLARISQATGLGKGSLYHFFPGGKDEMAAAVLADIDAWFQANIFAPLHEDTGQGIERMFARVEAYFASGRRICLVGVFALGNERDRFATQVRSYFTAWTEALTEALRHRGHEPRAAAALAEDVVAGIQGALVLARAVDDPAPFTRSLDRLHRRVAEQPSIKPSPIEGEGFRMS